MNRTTVREELFSMQDLQYRDFHSKLMPTVKKEQVIGVRVPMLRKYARRIAGTALAEDFLRELPHFYYEENNLHAFLIEQIADYAAGLLRLTVFCRMWIIGRRVICCIRRCSEKTPNDCSVKWSAGCVPKRFIPCALGLGC